jgi:hypothetical protein
VDNDKPRAAWEVYGSNDWMVDNIDATNGFAFEVRGVARGDVVVDVQGLRGCLAIK